MSFVNVILIKQVKNLGKIGDRISVRNGYAKNFLIPIKKAKFATKEVCNDIQQKLSQLESENIELINKSEDIKSKIHQLDVEIPCAASEGGQLFGSIKSKDIADAIEKAFGIAIDRNLVDLENPIKAVGKYEVDIMLHPEVTATVNIKVVYSQSNA